MQQPSLGLPSREYFTSVPRNDSKLRAYEQYAGDVAELLGAAGAAARYAADLEIKDMVDFEIQLARVEFNTFHSVKVKL